MESKCPTCGHSQERHLLLENGNGFTDGEYICVSAFCNCGRRSVIKKLAPKGKGKQSGLYFRKYKD